VDFSDLVFLDRTVHFYKKSRENSVFLYIDLIGFFILEYVF